MIETMTTSFENAMIAVMILAFIAVCIGSWVILRYARRASDTDSRGRQDVELGATSSSHASVDADKAFGNHVSVSSVGKPW